MAFRVSSLLVVCALISYSASVPLSWQQISVSNDAPPNVRWYAGVVATESAVQPGNDVLYVFGGQGVDDGVNVTGILGDTQMYEIDVDGGTGVWTEVGSAVNPEPMFGVVSGLVSNHWIITHGCDLDECYSDSWVFDLTTQQWSILINSSNHSGPIPSARRYTAGGVYPGEDELWLSMGESTSGRKLSDTWVLRVTTSGTEITAEWEEISPGGGLNQYNPFLPLARSLHAGTPISNSSFAIFGGCASGGQVGGPCPLQDTWVINLEDRKWEEISTCPRARARHAMVTMPLISGSAVILGGSQTYSAGVFPQQIFPMNYNETEVTFLVNATTWQRILLTSAVAPPRLEGASIAVVGGTIYLFGGKILDDDLFKVDVWALSGDPVDDDDQGCLSPLFTFVHLHGVLMYAAWGLFLPLGALLGRYYRWTWPCWFILHVICQSMGVLLTVAGFVIIFLVGNLEPNFAHAIIGIVLTAILLQQYLSGIFHPCVEREDGKTPSDEKGVYRRCWEIYHGTSGFISVAIGLAQVTLGVFLVGAPIVVWGLWCGLGGLWVITFLIHEIAYVTLLIVRKARD